MGDIVNIEVGSVRGHASLVKTFFMSAIVLGEVCVKRWLCAGEDPRIFGSRATVDGNRNEAKEPVCDIKWRGGWRGRRLVDTTVKHPQSSPIHA